MRHLFSFFFFFSFILFFSFDSFAEPPSVTQVRAIDIRTKDPAKFVDSLGINYRSFALYENDLMLDEKDSDFFAQKAISACQGIVVPPENPANWAIPPESQGELNEAYVHLMSVLNAGVAEKYPRLAAEAQTKFDCWVEQQEENQQQQHIDSCKSLFTLAISKIDQKMGLDSSEPEDKLEEEIIEKEVVEEEKSERKVEGPKKSEEEVAPWRERAPETPSSGNQPIINIYNYAPGAAVEAKPAPKPQEKEETKIVYEPKDVSSDKPLPKKLPLPVEIFFAFNSDVVAPKYDELLKGLANNMKKGEITVVRIEGHTDTSGSYQYNQALASRRANNVVMELLKYGVDPNNLEIIAKGETDLKIETGDSIPEAQNRRVKVKQP